jgi:Flp pilus assembly protein TadD
VSYQVGDVEAAIADLQRAVDLDPDDAELRYNRAFAYQNAGLLDAALADLDVAARLAPNDPDITAALSACRRQVLSPR